jgi:hypothetical protein
MLTGSMRVVMLLPPKGSAPGPSPDGPTGVLQDPSSNERLEDLDSQGSYHEGSNGDAGLTGDLFGASIRTVREGSMRALWIVAEARAALRADGLSPTLGGP